MTALLCYLVGPPGVGKSTVMAELTRACARMPAAKPLAHDALIRRDLIVGAELGRRRATFPGTDTLAMNVQPTAVRWLGEHPYDLLLAEGARLGTAGFLLSARTAGYRVLVVELDAPDTTLEARRASRGTEQNLSWVKGATTRARRLTARVALDTTVHKVDATAAPADVAAQVMNFDSALEVLRA